MKTGSSALINAGHIDANVNVPRTSRAVPRWLAVALTGALTFVAAAGVVGMVLLVAHAYRPVIVCVCALIAAAVAAVAACRRLESNPAADHRSAIAAVAIAVAFLSIAGAFHSEHLMLDRDPAAYVDAGRLIASESRLDPVAKFGPFDKREFFVSSPGFYDAGGGRLQPGFVPMLPILLSLGWAVGGYGGLLLVGPLLGALGLLAAYALASTLLGPRWSVLVPVVLAINPLQSWFARDAYSELVVQVLALGGIWLYLLARDVRATRIAALSGAIIATCALARIDAPILVAALVLFAAVDWTRLTEARHIPTAFVVALLSLGVYCTVLTHLTSWRYFEQQRHLTRPLYAYALISALIGLVWCVAHRHKSQLGERVMRSRAIFGAVAAVVLISCAWALVWRPSNKARAFALSDVLDPVDDRRSWLHAHWSWSARWLVEWFGVAAVAIAIVGLLFLCRRALRRDPAATAFVLVAGTATAIVLTIPRVSPDQPWAMRRLLPVVVPALIISLVVAFRAAWQGIHLLPQRWRVVALIGFAAVALGAIGPSLQAAVPLAGARAQHGAEAAISSLCDRLPANAAVLIYPVSYLDNELTPTVRSFCRVPTARAPITPDLDISALARRWRDEGRVLYVVSAEPRSLRDRDGVVVTDIAHLVIDDRYAPRTTYRVRPREYEPQPRDLWLSRVQAAPS